MKNPTKSRLMLNKLCGYAMASAQQNDSIDDPIEGFDLTMREVIEEADAVIKYADVPPSYRELLVIAAAEKDIKTLAGARELKRLTEETILDLLTGFTKRTGMPVDHVGIEYDRSMSFDNGVSFTYAAINLNVSLDDESR